MKKKQLQVLTNRWINSVKKSWRSRVVTDIPLDGENTTRDRMDEVIWWDVPNVAVGRQHAGVTVWHHKASSRVLVNEIST